MKTFYSTLRKTGKRLKWRRAALVVFSLLTWAHVSPSAAQQSNANSSADPHKSICALEAPWNRTDGLDGRAKNIKPADEWATPLLDSGHAAGKLSGLWSFELKGIPPGGDVATAGRLLFYQAGEGYNCTPDEGCGYKAAKKDAKWLVGGERWGHYNNRLLTPQNPEGIPETYLAMAASGAFTLPQAAYYPFPEITGKFNAQSPDTFTGTWKTQWRGETNTGTAVFTRIKPKIVGVKYISTIAHETLPNETGCVAVDYSAQWWGPGNNMRGNRPGFDIEIYSKDFLWFVKERYKIWIDPETRLEIDSSSPNPIQALDENGHPTTQLIGLRVHINIWPGSKWGPKTLFVEGQPFLFDYYVKPTYPFQIDPIDFQLAEGHFPEKPAPGQPTNLGFRLINLPDHAARGAILDLAFFDAGDFSPAENIKIFDDACKQSGAGAVRCHYDEIALAGLEEVEFNIPMPDKGLRWIATWKAEGGDPDGDVQEGVIEADGSPQIIHAFSLSDQTGAFRPQTTDYLYPYLGTGAIQQKREVILFGKNLPQKFGDDAHIVSLDPAISYIPRFGVAYKNRYDAAWADLAKRFKTPVEKLKEKHQLLLLDAQINGRILPGEQSLKLNGKSASWDLRFGGLNAKLEFIREVTHPQTGETQSEVLENAYVPERVRVRVTTSAPLPLDHIPLVLHLQRTNTNPESLRTARGEPAATTLNKITLTATTTTGNPTVYLSDPIRLVNKGNPRLSPMPRPGDIPLDVFLNGPGPDQLAVEIKPEFAVKSFLLPILPASAALPISHTPAKHRLARDPTLTSDFLFKSALAKAAQCRDDVAVDDWGKLSLAEADAFYNLVVITHGDHLRKTKVRFAHHAAMLMMRDMLVELLNEQMTRDSRILQSELALKGFLIGMRLALDNNSIPINRIKVPAPDGTMIDYGGMPLYENVEFLARKYKSTPEQMAHWRLAVTADAISQIDAEASTAAEHARNIGDCDVEGLLKLTGAGFDPVNARLRPRLMRLIEKADAGSTQTRLYWEPDLAARYWIDDISRVSKRLAAQRQTAADDNARLSFLFGIVTAPIIAGSAPIISVTLTGANLSLLGADTAGEWVKAYESQIELDFSRDAAVALGFARNDAAIKKAVSWNNAYNKTLLAIGLGALDVYNVKEDIAVGLFRSKVIYLKGRLVARNIPRGGLRALSVTERHNLQLFALRAEARRIALGADALDAVERRAITAIEDDFRAAQTELIRSTENGSKTLGFGDELTLPPPFGEKTAIVRFEPVRLPTAAPGEIAAFTADGTPIKMARVSDDFAEGTTSAFRTGGDTIPPPPRTEVLPPPDLPLTLWQKLAQARDIPVLRGRALADEVISIPPAPGAKPIPFPLDAPRGAGTFSTAMETEAPFAEFPTLVKVNFGGHDKAEVFGEAALESVGSKRFLLPRKVMSIDIPPGSPGYLRFFKNISVEEDMGATASVLFRNGGVTDLHRAAIRAALDDINDAGYVFLDFKWNNFSFVERNGRIRLGFFDFGGIVRVKGADPALAREIQNIVVGPWDDVHRALQDFGLNWPYASEIRALGPTQGRRALIIGKYGDQFEDIEKLGVPSIDKLLFLPSAGDRLDAATTGLFTKARLKAPE